MHTTIVIRRKQSVIDRHAGKVFDTAPAPVRLVPAHREETLSVRTAWYLNHSCYQYLHWLCVWGAQKTETNAILTVIQNIVCVCACVCVCVVSYIHLSLLARRFV